MGSIQTFPKRLRARTPADGWRMAPLPTGMVNVRTALPEDFAILHALHRQALPSRTALTMKQLEAQRHAFPEGQLVAMQGGRAVGAATSLVLPWERHAFHPRWEEVTADGTFASHDAEGDTLFAVETLVDSSQRGFGVGRALLQARRQLCRKLNLRRIVAAAPLTGYAHIPGVSPEQFATRIVMGDLPDPLLAFHLAQGFQYCGVARDFLPVEGESRGNAALMVWINPAHTPHPPPAREEGAALKCA